MGRRKYRLTDTHANLIIIKEDTLDTITLYRAECPNYRIGPFCDFGLELEDALYAEAGEMHNGNPRFPSPNGDEFDKGYPPISDEHLCAVETLALWCEWFPQSCAKVLARNGYVLALYEVPADYVWRGERQAVFDRRSAKHLRDLHPLTLEQLSR